MHFGATKKPAIKAPTTAIDASPCGRNSREYRGVRLEVENAMLRGELNARYAAQYLADVVAWAAIGARTTESQIHRELASR